MFVLEQFSFLDHFTCLLIVISFTFQMTKNWFSDSNSSALGFEWGEAASETSESGVRRQEDRAKSGKESR